MVGEKVDRAHMALFNRPNEYKVAVYERRIMVQRQATAICTMYKRLPTGFWQ